MLRELSDNFTNLSGLELIHRLSSIFFFLGYVVEKPKESGNHLPDFILHKNDLKTVVQVKRNVGTVTSESIWEAVALMMRHNAVKSIVVTTGSFTKSTIELAIYNDVDLWDGKKLINVVHQLNQQIPTDKKDLNSDESNSS